MKHCSCMLNGALFFIALLQCSEMSVSGNGGSSETINAKIIISDSVVTAVDDRRDNNGLIIDAFSNDYRPYEKSGFTAGSDSTAANPRLVIPASGQYNFLLQTKGKNRTGFISGVYVNRKGSDTIRCTLSEWGSVDGRIVSQDSTIIAERYAVSIYGTPFTCVTDNMNSFSMKMLPDGAYTIAVRPVAKRLFITSAKYSFVTENIGGKKTVLELVIP